MTLSASLQDYLEAILVLEKEQAAVRVKDIADHLHVKRQSVIDAVKLLKDKALIVQEKFGAISLTAKGKKIAREVLNTHQLIKEFLQGVLELDEKTAEIDACKMEHYLSSKTLLLITRYIEKKSK